MVLSCSFPVLLDSRTGAQLEGYSSIVEHLCTTGTTGTSAANELVQLAILTSDFRYLTHYYYYVHIPNYTRYTSKLLSKCIPFPLQYHIIPRLRNDSIKYCLGCLDLSYKPQKVLDQLLAILRYLAIPPANYRCIQLLDDFLQEFNFNNNCLYFFDVLSCIKNNSNRYKKYLAQLNGKSSAETINPESNMILIISKKKISSFTKSIEIKSDPDSLKISSNFPFLNKYENKNENENEDEDENENEISNYLFGNQISPADIYIFSVIISLTNNDLPDKSIKKFLSYKYSFLLKYIDSVLDNDLIFNIN
ncbi:uncharacterized protein ASCRUDRAFT_6847 [Ascoidea rubescens DSM 1968]|uniref:Mitochondrial outer membrane transport complex Sam37/metaxin N-terminal domain-containing protein n=1 Tax=Ascoidea rubescens DSM 1968 TaxID=1344418 RepID=A0A1D2VKV7_9ASCO|nr:hypothetical protein ASCRUDRAFT_6847 [Ascoidea rubescens DSM 1968]ODV62239.1 hypothetical protein ASCRUDRAFT_6847 [Ascoidea rubescens DSM 1968]